MRESDFRVVQHEVGESPAWPITYADLEPYYSQAEHLYHVHGSSEGDPTEPPRSSPFPHRPIPHAPRIATLVKRLRDSGACVSPIPRAIDYEGGKCVLCAGCDSYYCQLDAKMDAEIAALRPALRTGNVDLLTNTECLRILTSADGSKATGIVIRRQDTEQTVEANVVAVCAGLPLSGQLLLRSRNTKHPRGLGNSNDCVGRYQGGHTTGILLPILGLAKLPVMHTKTFAINSYYHASPDWPHPTGVIQAGGQIPFWDDEGAISWWKRPAARFLGQRSLFCFFMTEALPTRESGFDVDGETIVRWTPPLHSTKTFAKLRKLAIEAFKRAGCLVIAPAGQSRSVWHATGTVCFGVDPKSSVLNPSCTAHDIDNLYVVDSSVMPSAGAVNTGLTIAALALRAGDTIPNLKAAG